MDNLFDSIRDSSAKLNRMSEIADLYIQSFEEQLFQMVFNDLIIIKIKSEKDRPCFRIAYGRLSNEHLPCVLCSIYADDFVPLTTISVIFKIRAVRHLSELVKKLEKQMTEDMILAKEIMLQMNIIAKDDRGVCDD